jgi:Fe-S cluster assembly protein SufD
VTQARDSRYTLSALTTGAGLSRHELHINLNASNAECHIHTLQAITAQQQADFTSVMTHAAPHCRSHQVVRNVVSGSARAVFQGKIIVVPDAQKTDATQQSKSLLLSRTAEANAKPELEILADDVKCSHGATVGALDENALFYLTARGLAPDAARALLIEAFLTEGLLECSALRPHITKWLGAHHG